VRRQTQEAYAHQDVPFAKLVEELAPERDPSRNPLFQVSLVKGTEPGERPELRGLTVDAVETKGTETVKFDLNLSVAEEDQKIRVVIEYATDLFDASTIKRMAGHWRVLLDEAEPLSLWISTQEELGVLHRLSDLSLKGGGFGRAVNREARSAQDRG
jgi:non-ribosomal peptide synthetase component F